MSAYEEMERIDMIAVGGSSDDDQLYQMSQRLEPRERWQSERLTLVRSHRVLSAAGCTSTLNRSLRICYTDIKEVSN